MVYLLIPVKTATAAEIQMYKGRLNLKLVLLWIPVGMQERLWKIIAEATYVRRRLFPAWVAVNSALVKIRHSEILIT